MTLDQIRYYIAAAEYGSFSAAAEALFLSHSTISRAITALEEELNVQLLYRGKPIRLTAAGEIFLKKGKLLIRQSAALKDSVAAYQIRKQLRIITIRADMPGVYERIRQFRTAFPETELMMREADQHMVYQMIAEGEADIGFSFSYSWPEDAALAWAEVEHGKFCALLPREHELAERKSLTVREILTSPDLLGGDPLRDTGREYRGENLQSVILRVKAGEGITVIPEHVAMEFGHGCAQIPIADMGREYQLRMAWREENRSVAVRDFIALFDLPE